MKAKLRRPIAVSRNFTECIEVLNRYHFEDGEIILGRYSEGSTTKQIIAIGGINGEFELFFPYSSRNNTVEDILSLINSSDGTHSVADAISYIKQNLRKLPSGEYHISDLGQPDNDLLTLSDVTKAMCSAIKSLNINIATDTSMYVKKNLVEYPSIFSRGNITSTGVSNVDPITGFLNVSGDNGVLSDFVNRESIANVEAEFEEGDDFTVSFLMSYSVNDEGGESSNSVTPSGKPTFLLKGISGYNGLEGTLDPYGAPVVLSYSGKWRKAGDITPQFNFANTTGGFVIYSWKIEKSPKPTGLSLDNLVLLRFYRFFNNLSSRVDKFETKANAFDKLKEEFDTLKQEFATAKEDIKKLKSSSANNPSTNV